MSDDRRRDGSKLSFSELDKLGKERRSRGDGDRERNSRRARSHGQKAYRAALERAFESRGVEELAATLSRKADPRPTAPADPPAGSRPDTTDPLPTNSAATAKPRSSGKSALAKRRQLLTQIRAADNAERITKAVDRYLAEFASLPDDYEILEKALNHRTSAVVIQVLEQLLANLGGEKPRRSRSLTMRLTILQDTHDDDDVCALAAEVRAAL